MIKPVLKYGLVLALGAFALQWLEYRFAVHHFSPEFYVVIIATAFCALGIWVGGRLTGPGETLPFERNAKAQLALGISAREMEVMEMLACGHTNQEIADQLFVSANTIKTHLKHLYDKLQVKRRTQAVRKARELQLIP